MNRESSCPVPGPRSRLSIIAGIALAWSAGLTTGCGNNSVSEIEDLQSASLVSRGQELGQTVKYIESYERFELNEFRDKVNSGLNRWMTTRVAGDDSWQLPQLTGTLPDAIRSEPVYINLSNDRFAGNDANFVQQSFWIEEVANRVSDGYPIFNHEYFLQLALGQASAAEKQQWQESTNLLADIVSKLNPQLNSRPEREDTASEVEQLARAMELFDWTIRNIQLVDAHPWPTAETIGELALVRDVDPEIWPPAAGALGPGYVRYPWQTLTYGKGDYLDRAHIFALLCESAGIPATILAIAGDGASGQPAREWVVSTLIGDQLYLFDTLLGLPLLGEQPGSIATLAEVVANPELLQSLDLTPEESVEKQDYRVTADDLENLTALVVSEPEAISKRMLLVQRALTGDSRLRLVSQPDELAGALSDSPHIQDVSMWHVPFSTQIFREQVGQALNKAQFDQDLSQKLTWLANDEFYIDNFVMFRTARNMYLRGIFETDRNSNIRSALSYYFMFMYSDDEITEVENDPLLQMSLGIRRVAGQDFRSWQQQIQYLKSNMARIRTDAGFFLALAHYENANPQPALNWLDRLPELDDDSRWEPWRSYQQGRAFEAAGKYPEAEAAYSNDQSAQKAGSRIRARWMKQLSAEPSS